jgi:hypothetical protein
MESSTIAYRAVAGVALAAPPAFVAATLIRDGVGGDLVAPIYLGVIALIVIGGLIAFHETRRNGGAYRAGLGVALETAFILSWMNPAVGIIGNESNPANLMYLGVLAVEVIGAILVRLRPEGMARALVATAAAQLCVGVITLASGLGFTLVLDACFAALWLLAAWLFRKAARMEVTPAETAAGHPIGIGGANHR